MSFNHVTITLGSAAAGIDYLLSDIDEDDGDPRARDVVEALKALAASM